MLNYYFDEIIRSHKSEGKLEETNMQFVIDNQIISYNVFTLRLKRIGESDLDFDYYNAQLIKKIKTNPNLYKEIREYNLVLRFFKKLKIQDGYIKKSETPDFILERNNKKYGIEVTRIYAGNDWIAEKLHNDIVAYRLKDKNVSAYINYKKYEGKIKTYNSSKGIVVKAVKNKELKEEEIIQIKNKIFEKVRKLIYDYNKYDYNFIFAEIVFSGYEELEKLEKLNAEINYFITHLDIIWGVGEFHLILKVGNNWSDFDLKNGTYIEL